MALYAFDGTWNRAKDGEDPQYRNTNVVRFYRAYQRHSGTNDFYVAGVGTRLAFLGRAFGGAFGMGELPRLNEAYDHLCRVWAEGDHVIDVVGFSRGAATTLDFCHRVLERGIRKPRADTVVERNPTIRFLGVWDIVAAFGLANLGVTDLNIGHHLSLPKANLTFCFHAMALDERRPSFMPTRLHGAQEVWFRGVHSDVGGGNGNQGLNDITLKWMMSKAKAAGLPIDDADIALLQPNPKTPPHQDKKLPLTVRLISAVDRRHYTVAPEDGCTMPPDTCSVETVADEQQARQLDAGGVILFSPEVRARIDAIGQSAEAAAKELDFPLAGVRDALGTLIQGRIPLVTTDQQLSKARESVTRLVAAMVRGAQKRGFHALNEFFLTEALFDLRPLFPFTD